MLFDNLSLSVCVQWSQSSMVGKHEFHVSTLSLVTWQRCAAQISTIQGGQTESNRLSMCVFFWFSISVRCVWVGATVLIWTLFSYNSQVPTLTLFLFTILSYYVLFYIQHIFLPPQPISNIGMPFDMLLHNTPLVWLFTSWVIWHQ